MIWKNKEICSKPGKVTQRIKELSLKQRLFFPSFLTGVLSHLLVFLILTVGLHINFLWAYREIRIKGAIDINLYRSFKKVKKTEKAPRGARKIVQPEEIPKETPTEVVEDDEPDTSEMDEAARAATIAEAYLGSIYRRIDRRKYYPEVEQERYHEGVVRVAFVIKRDGALEKAWVVKKSKHSGLNRAALETVKRSAPFMPIPPELKGGKLPIVMNIVYKII